MKNKIIFVNGTSSVGKTSLVHEFQNLVAECYYGIEMDSIFSMLPRRYLVFRNHKEFNPKLDNLLTDENRKGFYFEGSKRCKLGEYAKNISRDFLDIILSLAILGRNIIVDFITYGIEDKQLIAKMFSSFNCYFITLSCNPEELRKRELQRGNRIIGSAEDNVKFIDMEYTDYIIDTTIKRPVELAKKLYNFVNAHGPRAMTLLLNS
ncbi:MAG: AAA family ATPase [Rickettsiales bacterium]|jgi:chloramphenicol 3-O phosphotransferase|nr:AAA family ATPase [Rickettsiales bacterium]